MPMDKKKKIAQLIIARLDGSDCNESFASYKRLVEKGIGGFIVFGGTLRGVSRTIKRLQDKAEIPLFIASDLEQGLGQQIEGATLFPSAMAMAQAIKRTQKKDRELLRRAISIIAREARAAGINIIFSPVLDINTNPLNPIICTRAFSDDPDTVAWFGREVIKGFQREGLLACAKHFPGHGDTSRDSHRELPVVHSGIQRLRNVELYPFQQAVKAGVKMIMVGHLKIPALDTRYASSLSSKIITGLLKEKMKFNGLAITDAMNMHAVSQKRQKGEERACLRALKAGADILLHPSNPEKVIGFLSSRWSEIEKYVELSFKRIVKRKKELGRIPFSSISLNRVGTPSSIRIARDIARKSIKIIPKNPPLLKGELVKPLVLIVDDDNAKSGNTFIKTLRRCYPKIQTRYIDNKNTGDIKALLNEVSNRTMIIVVFSKISAWKSRSGLSKKLFRLLERTIKKSKHAVIVGFCCPHVLNCIEADVIIEAYSGEALSQKAAAERFCVP
jgi:beta-glucosidase-like glycosyl hydrolase